MREWLLHEDQSLYCVYCLCFGGDLSRKIPLVRGINPEQPAHRLVQHIRSHESSNLHRVAKQEYVNAVQGSMDRIKYSPEANCNREILKSILRAIIFCATHGRCLVYLLLYEQKYNKILILNTGLAFRSSSNESARNLNLSDDPSKNFFKVDSEGKFIGLLKLISIDNILLKDHLLKCKLQGRSEGHLTFLSNHFLDKVLLIVKKHVVGAIVKEIHENGNIFGLEMDTTQDLTAKEQCSIVVRYVNSESKICERTIAFVECKSTTGYELYQLLEKSLNEIDLEVCNIVGFSFDGGANMRSSEVGVHHYIKQKSPRSIFVWCFSHRLNLCVKAAFSNSKAKYVLGLAENTAVFLRKSYLRMNVWTQVARELPNRRSNTKLKIIGGTRWTSKDDAMHNIVQTELHLLIIIKAFLIISNTVDLKIGALNTAHNILTGWLNYENIMVAFIMDQIFQVLLPVTKRLQMRGLSMTGAMKDISALHEDLEQLRNSHETLIENAKTFIRRLNVLIESDAYILSLNMVEDLFKVDELESEFDEILLSEVIAPVIDTLLREIEERFFFESQENLTLFEELSFLDVDNLEELQKKNETDTISLKMLCELNDIEDEEEVVRDLIQFLSEVNHPQIASTTSFLHAFEVENTNNACFVNNESIENNNNGLDSDDDSADDGDCNENRSSYNDNDTNNLTHYIESEDDLTENIASNQNILYCPEKECSCLQCVLKYFNDELKNKYKNLFKLYKYAASIPITEVKCESDFSKLKSTKNDKRTSLTETKLQNLMIISTEADLFSKIDLEIIIDEIGKSSKYLAKCLL